MHYVSNCESYAIIVAINQEITFHYFSPANRVVSFTVVRHFCLLIPLSSSRWFTHHSHQL